MTETQQTIFACIGRPSYKHRDLTGQTFGETQKSISEWARATFPGGDDDWTQVQVPDDEPSEAAVRLVEMAYRDGLCDDSRPFRFEVRKPDCTIEAFLVEVEPAMFHAYPA